MVGDITVDAALLSLRIIHLHRLPAAVPAAGSCSNTAAGRVADVCRRLDSCSVVKLSISIASRIRVGGTIVIVQGGRHLLRNSCEKKIK